jgi:hypothetical protein
VSEKNVLQVIVEASQFAPDGSRGTVVIESDCTGPPFTEAFQELESQAAVSLAQQYATTQGCSPAYLNGNKSGAYPVNADGLSLEQVRGGKGEPLPQTHPKMQPARYRVDVPVSRPLR